MSHKPPAFQLYAKDWRSSPTIHRMNRQEIGDYITLLIAAWDSDDPGTLPLPIELAAKCAGTDPRVVRNFLRKFPRCFEQVGQQLVNRKLREQYIKLLELSEKRKQAANSRYANAPANALQVDHSASALAFATASAKEQEPPLTPPGPKPKKPTGPDFILPDWIPSEKWEAFVEMRQRQRCNPTVRAKRLLVAKLETLKTQGHEPGAVLDQSTMNAWRGVFELRANGNSNGERKTWSQLHEERSLMYLDKVAKQIEEEKQNAKTGVPRNIH